MTSSQDFTVISKMKQFLDFAHLCFALIRFSRKGLPGLRQVCNFGTPGIMRTNHAHIICTPRGPPFGITKDFAAKLLQ